MAQEGRQHRGFTLLELLVVIGIIALLMTMLLPALGRAKELARNAVCKVNLGHLAKAAAMYAEEDDRERYVLAAEDISTTNLKRWHGERDAVNEPFDPSRTPLRPYLGSDRIEECPSFRDKLDDDDSPFAFENGCGGYGYNQFSVGGGYVRDGYDPWIPVGAGGFNPDTNGARISDVRDPAETVMFTDSAQLREDVGPGELIAYSFCEPTEKPGSPTPNASIHFRHLGHTNVAWVATTVSQEDMSFTASYATYGPPDEETVRKNNLGWFGPESNELFDLK